MGKSIAVSVVALMVLAGCGWRKQHLTSSYGLSYDSAFAAQRDRKPDRAPAVAASGLDAQESAIISDTYRKGLAGKQGAARQEPLILLSPAQPERSNMPPPSVPKE